MNFTLGSIFSANKNCNILNVSLDPCPDATKNQPCKLYRGSNVTWTFDYTPRKYLHGF